MVDYDKVYKERLLMTNFILSSFIVFQFFNLYAAGSLVLSKNIVLDEGFNNEIFPPSGWQITIVAGNHTWQRRTVNTNPPCEPYEGSGMASYPSYSAPEGSRARLISCPVFLGSNLYACSLKFYMYHDQGYNDCQDRIIIEYSADGINFFPVESVSRYRSGNPRWLLHQFYLGNFSDTVWLSFLAHSDYGNNMNIDKVQLTTYLETLRNDLGVEEIIFPYYQHGINTPLVPVASIKNYGFGAQNNFWVICSLFGSTGSLYYIDSVLVPQLLAGERISVAFSNWLPTVLETIFIKIATNLETDSNHLNDSKFKTVSIERLIDLISPNGGEVLQGGDSFLIRWTSFNSLFEHYHIVFSSDGGINYQDTIVRNLLPQDTLYNWNIPLIDFNTCRIKILGVDSSGYLLAVDESDSNFFIDATPPVVPILISPSHECYLNDSLILFVWHSSEDGPLGSGVLEYELALAYDSSFSSSVLFAVEDTSYVLPLTDSGYFWRVRAIDRAYNQSSWSQYRQFEIDTRVPGVPVLILPSLGVWLNDSSVIFNWSGVRGFRNAPVRYLIQIDTTVDFLSPHSETTSFTYDTLILSEDFYFWRVKAFDEAGNEGDFCLPDSFGVDYTPPDVPLTISPSNNALLADTVVNFIWHQGGDNLSGVNYYELEYATDSMFINSTTISISETTIVLILAQNRYFWRLRSIDRAGNISAFSEVQCFQIVGSGIFDASRIGDFKTGLILTTSLTPISKNISIVFTLLSCEKVLLEIYNLEGQIVQRLVNSQLAPGTYEVLWDLKTSKNQAIGCGVYFITLQTSKLRLTRKILIF
jgi:hypothetical protein